MGNADAVRVPARAVSDGDLVAIAQARYRPETRGDSPRKRAYFSHLSAFVCEKGRVFRLFSSQARGDFE
jgi:hypothetical protein